LIQFASPEVNLHRCWSSEAGSKLGLMYRMGIPIKQKN